jgi:hypothetical protein
MFETGTSGKELSKAKRLSKLRRSSPSVYKLDSLDSKQEQDIEEKPATQTTCAKTKESVFTTNCDSDCTERRRIEVNNRRILFDTGSQRSYITDNLKTRLGLKTTKTETLQLNTFGGKGLQETKM